MSISGKVKTNQDKIALKCYNMMKAMYKDEYSEIIDMFYGIQVSDVRSKESSYNNITAEPILCLNLEIGDKNIRRMYRKIYIIRRVDMKIEVNEK